MNGFMLLSMSLLLTASGERLTALELSSAQAMMEVNQLRSSRGLPGFHWDEHLMQVARMRAEQLASRGQGAVHPPGSFSPARYEGVGLGHRFNTCYLYSQVGRSAGAATIERYGRRYHVLLIR